jgi:transposase
MVILASAGGNSVPVIARLMQADEDSVRQVIHRFNEMGLGCLDPQWAGGRPRRISPDDEAFIVTTATTRPKRWGSRSPAGVCASSPTTSLTTAVRAGLSSAGNGCGSSCAHTV